MPRATGLVHAPAGGEFDRAIVQESLYLGSERQIAGSGEMSKLIEQAKPKKIDPDPVQRLVFVDRSPVSRLPFEDLLRRASSWARPRQTTLAHFEGEDRVRLVGKLQQRGPAAACASGRAMAVPSYAIDVSKADTARSPPRRRHADAAKTEAGLADHFARFLIAESLLLPIPLVSPHHSAHGILFIKSGTATGQ